MYSDAFSISIYMVHVGDLCDPVTDPPRGDWSKVNKLYGGPWLLASCHVSLTFLSVVL